MCARVCVCAAVDPWVTPPPFKVREYTKQRGGATKGAQVLTHLAATVVVDARCHLLDTHLLGGKGLRLGSG